MNVIINLIVAVLVFIFAKWVLAIVGLGEPWLTLVAILLACLVFFGDPLNRFRLVR